MKLDDTYVIYDRQRGNLDGFYNYRTGQFGLFSDATLCGDPEEARDLIPDGEEWCVVMKVTATAEVVMP